MKLQLALDVPDLTYELELAGKVAGYVDILEVGTPLLIREGIRAVREMRRRHRGCTIAADIKVIDAGEPIAELAFAAGASIVTVLGCASNEVIERVVKSAQRYECAVMADSLSVSDIPKRARELAEMGVTSLCLNRRGFGQKNSADRAIRVAQIAEMIEQISLPVFLAGGIDTEEMQLLCCLPLAGVIVGAAIAEAASPVKVAQDMRALIAAKQK